LALYVKCGCLSESLSPNNFIFANYPSKDNMALCNINPIGGTEHIKVPIAMQVVSKCLNMSNRIIIANLLRQMRNIIIKELVQEKNAAVRKKRNA
jgi:hypothetical protein